MSERYLKGIEIAERLAAEKLEEFTTSRVAELAPDFARMAIEFPLGDLYTREGLDLKSREIAAISSLATLGNAGPQLRIHIRAATTIGLSKSEIIEILMQTAVYAGFPAALNAMAACHDLLTEECPRRARRQEWEGEIVSTGPVACNGGKG
jgi:4-carboxymuconolactone decarboxylase